jgi:8-oxo-dGTP pyrophosphatase MutT (NUDIX family)
VLVRPGTRSVLAFAHPLAGLQLVKAKIERGETAHAAAVRELREEAGLRVALAKHLIVNAAVGEQRWAFFLCDAPPLPEHWSHWCSDGGGHLFRFFWHPLDSAQLAPWHPDFRAALGVLKAAKL